MNVLYELIQSLKKDELRFFNLLVKRVQLSTKRKDLQLLEYYKKNSSNYDDDRIAHKLYKHKKNSFFRLKNRLQIDLLNSLTFQNINKEMELVIVRLITVSRKMKAREKIDLAICFLIKAEKKAIKIESFEFLNIIYSDFIKLSYESPLLEVEKYIEKSKNNFKKMNQIQEIDNVLAAVNHRLRKAQNYSKANTKIIEILEKTIKDFTQNKEIINSEKLKIKIFQSTSKLLLQKRKYQDLEEFLKHSFKDFKSNSIFNKKNHDLKLQLLTYLVNCLFKNKKHQESLTVAMELYKEMEKYNGFLRNKYLFYYYNGLVINYSRIDQSKAIEILLKAKSEPSIIQSDYHYFFICSNLALQYYDQSQYKLAIKTLSRIIQHKNFLNFDESFQIKIISAELIIRYEIGDFDIIEIRFKVIKRRFSSLLQKNNFQREKLLFKIINKLIFTQRIDLNKSLLDDINSLLCIYSDKEADENDIINYNRWLREKILKK